MRWRFSTRIVLLDIEGGGCGLEMLLSSVSSDMSFGFNLCRNCVFWRHIFSTYCLVKLKFEHKSKLGDAKRGLILQKSWSLSKEETRNPPICKK